MSFASKQARRAYAQANHPHNFKSIQLTTWDQVHAKGVPVHITSVTLGDRTITRYEAEVNGILYRCDEDTRYARRIVPNR